MVELAEQLTGWTRSVYRYGCAFIHLSRFHDYAAADPLSLLPSSEREDIVRHMNSYHGSPTDPEVTFAELMPYLPMVLDKVASNLGCYVRDLERGFGLDQASEE